MKLLVTGGAGFIGSAFIRYELNKHPDYQIINLDNLTYCSTLDSTYSVSNNPNYKFIKGDICDKKLVRQLVKEVDCVINFAAESHVDNSIKFPDIFIKTNVLGTQNLLQASLEFGIEKFLQVSTDEVYGSCTTSSFAEESNLVPNSPYSASKASSDLLVRAYYITYGLNTLNTRCANNYGIYQCAEKLIPFFVYKLMNNEKVTLYGDGLNVRDWIYVEDHIRALDLVLLNGKYGEVYNIGANCEKTNIDITKKILKYLNKDESYIHYVEDRLGHDRRYAICSDKIKKELNWSVKFDFDEAFEKTIKWYVDNIAWLNQSYKNLKR